jgi:uncharacterized protein (DUF305 family)
VSPRHVIGLLAAALCLGGCTAAPPVAAPAPAPVTSAPAFGGTDRAWIEINIAMGEELLPLLDLAPSRASSAQVKELAAGFAETSKAELTALYELHAAAGLPAENPHKGMPMPGMVTPAQVTEAAAASGPAFDKLLVEHLRAHVDQGVKLATSEGTSGVEPRTKKLAAEMIGARKELSLK